MELWTDDFDIARNWLLLLLLKNNTIYGVKAQFFIKPYKLFMQQIYFKAGK